MGDASVAKIRSAKRKKRRKREMEEMAELPEKFRARLVGAAVEREILRWIPSSSEAQEGTAP